MDAMSGESISSGLIEAAQGIAIIPSVVKVGLVVGERFGKGVLSVRRPTGEWSRPLFVSLSGGDVGWQIGAQSVDIVLLFASRRAVDILLSGELTLGVDASVAPGSVAPAGEKTVHDTGVEIQIYSISRDLFADIDLKRATLRVEAKDNERYYVQPQVRPEQVFDDDTDKLPESARLLKRLLKDRTKHEP
jgi:lipid-binding SYLF domain-containing protein